METPHHSPSVDAPVVAHCEQRLAVQLRTHGHVGFGGDRTAALCADVVGQAAQQLAAARDHHKARYELPRAYRVRAAHKAEPEIEHPGDAIVPDTRVGTTFGHEFTGWSRRSAPPHST